MRAEDRRQEIIRHLNEQGIVKVTELSNIFQVTEETIRRDLERLENEGYLKRTHGGAVKIAVNQEETAFHIRNMRNRYEKQLIGRKAAELVQPGDVIAVDASTTALQMVHYLKDKKDLVVITHALKVVMALVGNPDITVICTGGTLHPRTLSFVGPLVENALASYNIKKAFISCKGVTLEEGITESTEVQARVKAEMVRGAKEIILLADHDKFGTAALATVAPVTAVHTLITDSGTPEGEIEKFRRSGVRVIVAGGAITDVPEKVSASS
ncbi:putative HTH-type transcriptional regulator YdjF [Neomoorella glycerini]|uniref:Putative HTH-type transcriptional regulator YdjF n=1 Tax=Neomoorella glycerini TaxID=55779 RepID=A0A6I5ZPV1_9FIRM|nr:DeoR/GlpR family DNA-binding transcription regulator [Moorella glycerini]QGP91609.1 putative HTH-type transcriptional regulator YdjF [Moorella glycerini]